MAMLDSAILSAALGQRSARRTHPVVDPGAREIVHTCPEKHFLSASYPALHDAIHYSLIHP
jgi:hypothetical protein